MRELRNQFIRRRYDAMSAKGMSDLVVVRELVLAHRLSYAQYPIHFERGRPQGGERVDGFICS